MADNIKNYYKADNSKKANLDLFIEFDSGNSLSQRNLAEKTGVALGLVNALIKRAVNKGLVKIKEAPSRRFAYYLTPKGFSEKSRLVSQYLTSSLNFFRQARGQYEQEFEVCYKKGWKRIAIIGSGELAEIAILSAIEIDVQLVFVVDSRRNDLTFCGLPVIGSLEHWKGKPIDAVIITDASDPQQAYLRLLSFIDENRILVPKILHVRRNLTSTIVEKRK